MLGNFYLIFFYAPIEAEMGFIQKIFYFHLPTAWVGLFAFFVVFIMSLGYLISKNNLFNQLAISSAEIGMIFLTIVLCTGPIWAKSVWNTYWSWEPRLTTTFILWVMFLAYLLLQSYKSEVDNLNNLAAVYAVIASVNLPLVFFSIRWWRTIHPVIITATEWRLKDEMKIVLLFSIFSFSLLYLFLLFLRFTLGQQTDSVYQIKEKLSEIRSGNDDSILLNE